MDIGADKVQQAETVVVALVFWWGDDAVYGRLEESARDELWGKFGLAPRLSGPASLPQRHSIAGHPPYSQ